MLSFFSVIKDGVPTNDDLELLSMKLPGSAWKHLARSLKFDEAEITAFDSENRELREKAYKMLLKWKAKCGNELATYRVLYHTLCGERVGQTELAERFCYVSQH